MSNSLPKQAQVFGGEHQFDLFSVGHSTHDQSEFLEILHTFDIDGLADLRTSPWSGRNPQFNQKVLARAVEEGGITYVFLGEELGGRPDTEDLYDADGHALYGRMAETEKFGDGVDRLLSGAKRFNLAMMCSEEDPKNCHRFLLVTRVLFQRGITVGHIRGDKSVIRTEEVESFGDWGEPDYIEDSLFGGPARSAWRSTQPVLQRSRLSPSSHL